MVFDWFLHRKLVQTMTRVSNKTFQYLCEKLGPHLRKFVRNPILMEDRIVMSLIWEWLRFCQKSLKLYAEFHKLLMQ